MEDLWQQNTNLRIGRNRELNLLTSYLESSEGTVAVIKGVAGIGKSYLARCYAEIHKNKYSNVARWRGYNLPQSFQLLPNTLLIIDDADEMDNGVIERVQRANTDIKIIVTGRNLKKITADKFLVLNLQAFNMNETLHMLKICTNAEIHIDRVALDLYIKKSQGNPAILSLIIGLINKIGLSSVNNLIYEPDIMRDSGIVLPPEKKIETSSMFSIKTDVSNINDRLMRYIAENPSYMYQLTSRDFEEMMAKLFATLGYSVKLTKKTRDGGKDIYIAKKNEIGEFLFLVECKKYAPNNPVGVEVVRNLYGVMGMEKTEPTGGIIATTSYFTRDARQEIIDNKKEYRISLHDYEYICGLLKKAYLEN